MTATVTSSPPAAAGPSPHASRRGGVRQALRALLLATAAAGLLLGTVLLAPTAIGGPAAYVVTQGTSMLPTYEAGGVIVTRERESYGVGDVIAYRNPELAGTIVLHRVVDTDGERFVTQGDNNDFLDSFEPTSANIVGEAWIYAPRAGEILETLRHPVVFGVLVALMTLLALRSPPSADRRRRRHHGS